MDYVKQEKHRNIVSVRKSAMMHQIKTYNKISRKGLDLLCGEGYTIIENHDDADAILVRSELLNNKPLPDKLKAIGRAGAGVNNVPVDECTKKGIVVFNTPGANANAVKELVITGILLATRDILSAVQYVKSLANESDEVISAQVEANKSLYKGAEVAGKTLGVVGLGSIGMKVANDAVHLGLNVLGYDPFLSVHNAWELSARVRPAETLKELLSQCDFVSFHMPLNPETSNFVNREILSQLKLGAVVLNFSRQGIVDTDAMIDQLESGHIYKYITDFPSAKLIGLENVICTPHLGASTQQAEENCAVMIAKQLKDFLDNGNIRNSVNFPQCVLPRMTSHRLVIANCNIPNMVGQVTSILAKYSYNIVEMLNKSRKDVAYNILDIDQEVSEDVITEISQIEGLLFCREIKAV